MSVWPIETFIQFRNRTAIIVVRDGTRWIHAIHICMCMTLHYTITLFITYTYQKNGHPRQPNIVKRYRALERIGASLSAVRIILVPINARRISRIVVRKWFCGFIAHERPISIRREVSTLMHPTVFWRSANIVQFFWELVVEWYAGYKKWRINVL